MDKEASYDAEIKRLRDVIADIEATINKLATSPRTHSDIEHTIETIRDLIANNVASDGPSGNPR